MGAYKYIAEAWTRPKENIAELWRQRLIQWRQEPVVLKVEYPLRLDKARMLGYRAKKGFVIARVRVAKGSHKREKITSARKSKNTRRRVVLEKTYRLIAEERCQRQFVNLEVLNSYFVGKDGKHFWYEVILVNPHEPTIIADPRINWICEKQHTFRVFRGLTSPSIKSRGLRGKGKGYEKNRPSVSANRKIKKRKYGPRTDFDY